MKHHEHRLCTKLLCVILVIANILSVGMPVYAKSPDMSLDKTAYIDSEELPPSILESKMPDASDNTGTGPETVSGNSPDSEFDHSKPNLDSDTEENSGDDDSSSDPNTNSNDETDTETKDSDNFENTNNIDETENDSVSNNDTSPNKKVANENQAYSDSEYLTEDPQGYDLFDIHMMPGSYSAELSATSNQGNIREHSFKILYTTDNALADDFFKGSSKISENDLTESGIKLASFNSLKGKYRYDDSLNKNVFDISASFTGENILNPATTYYYRLVHCSWDSANQTNYYYFLTVPARFTTEAPLTKSSVSIKDIVVDDIGYQQAKVIWTIDNPNNEFISAIKLQCMDASQSFEITAKEYSENNVIVPNKYYVIVNLTHDTWIVQKAKATLITYIGNGDKSIIASNEVSLTPQDTNNAKISTSGKSGSNSFQVYLELSPYYAVDEKLQFKLYFREKDQMSWNSITKSLDPNGTESAHTTFLVSDLLENTLYEYYIEPTGLLSEKNFQNLGSEKEPLTIATKQIVTYTDADFPDEIFRNYIKSRIGINTSEQITSDKLETLTYLSYEMSTISGEIQSLKGINYLENLTQINFSGHSITDADGLNNLTGLTRIDLSYNDFNKLPDLSNMVRLTYANFNGNQIDPDTISESKLPSSLLTETHDWIEITQRNQRGKVEVTLASEYYAVGNTYPFPVRIAGLKKQLYSDRQYILSLTVNGKTVSSTDKTPTDGTDEIYYIKNILKDSSGSDTGITITEGAPCYATITLIDNYGRQWISQTEQVIFATEAEGIVHTQYLKPTAVYAGITISNLPSSYTSDNISSITLIDSEGSQIGTASSTDIHTYSFTEYNPYEGNLGYFNISGLTTGYITLQAFINFARYLNSGEYSTVITFKDQTSVTFEKVVCIEDIAVVNSLSLSNNSSIDSVYYDNQGEFLYVRLSGVNIDPTRLRPVFYKDEVDISEYINSRVSETRTQSEDEVLYKLRKLQKDTYWNVSPSGYNYFSFRIDVDPGYEYIDNIPGKFIGINPPSDEDFIIFEHYNYKKGVYEVKTDSRIANSTPVSVEVYTSSDYNEQNLKGMADGVVDDSLLSLTFKNSQGENYAPPNNSTAYFRYTYTDANGSKKTFDHTDSSVKWYNYYASASDIKSPNTDMTLYYKASLKKLDMNVSIPKEQINDTSTVTAQIVNGDTPVGNIAALSRTTSEQGYTKYTGTWKYDAGLSEGIYTIRFFLDDKIVHTTRLWVYDDTKFYMNNQQIGTWANKSDKGIYVNFSSEQLAGSYIHDYNRNVSDEQAFSYWNKGNYKLELFDRYGNLVTGWKADHASWTIANFYLYLTDIPEGYVGFHAKITRSGNSGIRLDNSNTYYSTAYNANEEYGKWEILGSDGIWFNSSRETNSYCGFLSYSYPVTVTITSPYDTASINTFAVSEASNNNSYYFTTSDLSMTDPQEVYRITVAGIDGRSDSVVGYLGVWNNTSDIIRPTGVTLNKSTLNLQLGQSEKLTATIKPDDATNKNVEWSSDNTAVATVDAQGNVTAIAVGTAKITVTTVDNGKAATCTVNVFNYTLDQSTLEFDLATEEGSKPKQLHVKNGDETITSNITWSSSDDSVATVTKDGIVTPVDAGTVKILAAVKNGPTLSCTVTVSNDTLTAVALSESSCELYVDTQGNAVKDETGQLIPQKPKTKSIKLYYSPSTAKLESVEWEKSDPAIVSVTPNADDPTRADIEALSKGTATITATVKTASGTETCTCTVTVKAVTSAADAEKTLPQGLTAFTNEQLTLGDVSLDDFPGWEWMEEEKSVTLAQFAGVQKKSFAATYTDPANPDAEPYEAAIPVNFITVTGIAIQAESSTIRKDNRSEFAINWIMNGPTNVTQPDMSEYVKKVAWSSDKPAVANVTTDTGGKTILVALSAGKATVKAQITFRNNKTYKAQYKITVVEGTPADIQVSEVSGFTANPSVPGTYQGKSGSNAADNNRTILAAVTGATSLTAKSNNAKVAAVGKVTATAKGTYTIPLTLKAAGMAKITLTANDTAKTQKDIFLYVTDSKPIISENPVTVNLQQADGTAFMIYSGNGYQVTTASLSRENANKFDLTSDPETPGGYILKANANTGTGSYKLSLNVQVKSSADPDAAAETFDNVALNVKVIDQKPKFKIKQSTKFNLFCKDWESRLEVTTDEVLNSAVLNECDFTLTQNDASDYMITAKTEGLTTNCNKAGKLTLTFAGYKPVETSLTVSTEYKKPRIALATKSATLYPNAGINSALIRLKDGKEDYLPTAMPVIDGTETANLFGLTKDGTSLLLTARSPETLPGSTKVTIILQETNWAEAVKLTYTVKTNKGKPSVKLGKATLQLNTNPSAASYDMAATEIMWKDGAALDASRVSVSAADNKAKALLNKEIAFRFDETKNQVIAKLNKTDPDKVITPGSYKFKVNAIKETGETTLTASTSLTVKIVNIEIKPGQKSKAIAISSKGSIDVLNREGTSVTVTAALKSLNGTVTGARLSGSAAHLFEIDKETPIKDNKVVIHAKSDVSLITKYAYKVKLNLTIENAEGDKFYYLTPYICLKLKQGKPKVTIAPKTATFFSGSYNNAVTRKLTVSLKGAESPAVEKVELVNDFDGAFDNNRINYDEQNGTFTLFTTEKAMKGKSYNLQLKVSFKDQADNEKPTVVKYSVKIK